MRWGVKKQTHTPKKAPRPQHPFLPLGSPDISWHARPEHERLQDSARAVSNKRCHPSASLPSHTPGGNIPRIKPHLGKEQSSHHCHAHYQKNSTCKWVQRDREKGTLNSRAWQQGLPWAWKKLKSIKRMFSFKKQNLVMALIKNPALICSGGGGRRLMGCSPHLPNFECISLLLATTSEARLIPRKRVCS